MNLFDPSPLGSSPRHDGCAFAVWAPTREKVELNLVGQHRLVPMEKRPDGLHVAHVAGVRAGERYMFRVDGQDRPDPASKFQPEGVHGPSQVVDTGFAWDDGAWSGLPLSDYVIYELHVGTFTPEGTFEAAIGKIDYLKNLGITAVEIMPISQFPGGRNWGYDGVYPFAAQNTYGGPEGFKKLVNAFHKAGLAVVLDVVYNHMGPEGNYLSVFGPYFTEKYKTPWGAALNFDDTYNEGVRRFFIENAVYWTAECHVDALRCDAIHAILDFSAQPFLEELCTHVHEASKSSGRKAYLIAESDLNDNRVIRSRELGGYGFDSQWCDDFHHALHVLLTGDKDGYYEDFGSVADFAKAVESAYVYDGRFSVHRKRRHGNSAAIFDARKFVVFNQNHDQVGNRMKGERLCHLANLERQKLAAAATIVSPYVPLFFMGEEYAEKAPFQYFISHEDADLVRAVQKGRRDEFKAFSWAGEPPDPQSEETFNNCKLDWSLHQNGQHAQLFAFYRELIRLRFELSSLRQMSREFMEVGFAEAEKALWIRRWLGRNETFAAFNFGEAPAVCPLPTGRWKKNVDSGDVKWGGPGAQVPDAPSSSGDGSLTLAPLSFVLISRLKET